MVLTNSGEKLGMYFDRELWAKIAQEARRLNVKPTEVIRMALRRYFDDPVLEKLEKLEELNSEMFVFLANKLSHSEFSSSLVRNKADLADVKKQVLEEEFAKIKSNNLDKVKEVLTELL